MDFDGASYALVYRIKVTICYFIESKEVAAKLTLTIYMEWRLPLNRTKMFIHVLLHVCLLALLRGYIDIYIFANQRIQFYRVFEKRNKTQEPKKKSNPIHLAERRCVYSTQIAFLFVYAFDFAFAGKDKNFDWNGECFVDKIVRGYFSVLTKSIKWWISCLFHIHIYIYISRMLIFYYYVSIYFILSYFSLYFPMPHNFISPTHNQNFVLPFSVGSTYSFTVHIYRLEPIEYESFILLSFKYFSECDTQLHGWYHTMETKEHAKNLLFRGKNEKKKRKPKIIQ